VGRKGSFRRVEKAPSLPKVKLRKADTVSSTRSVVGVIRK
jgi:hypothetical protein